MARIRGKQRNAPQLAPHEQHALHFEAEQAAFERLDVIILAEPGSAVIGRSQMIRLLIDRAYKALPPKVVADAESCLRRKSKSA